MRRATRMIILTAMIVLSADAPAQFNLPDSTPPSNRWTPTPQEMERVYYHFWAAAVVRDTVLLRPRQTLRIRTDNATIVLSYDSTLGSGNARESYFTLDHRDPDSDSLTKRRSVHLPYSTAELFDYFWLTWPCEWMWAWRDTLVGANPIDRWHFQVSMDSLFRQQFVFNDSNLTSTIKQWMLTDPDPGETYYARVRGQDSVVRAWTDWVNRSSHTTARALQLILPGDIIVGVETFGITRAVNAANRQVVLRITRAGRARFEHN